MEAERPQDRDRAGRGRAAVAAAFEVFSDRGDAKLLVETLLAISEPLGADALSLIGLQLRGPDGDLLIDASSNLGLWQALALRHEGVSLVGAALGDALARVGREDEGMVHYLAAFAREPLLALDLGDEVRPLAQALGGDVEFEYWLAVLRGQLTAAAAGEVSDDLRERYAELLEQYGGDPIAIERLRALGRQMAALEDSGALPRAFLRRGRSRRESGQE